MSLAALLLLTVYEMRDFGEPEGKMYIYDPVAGENVDGSVERTAMDDFFLANSTSDETATNNVVSAVVFDYRGFDTLGEATVLFAAVTGVMMALRGAFPEKGHAKKRKGGGVK
ncbi:MAG: hydrogenase [Thermoplasmata archaeon]|nr:hydrogenase [Thermoplasmata archaeon]